MGYIRSLPGEEDPAEQDGRAAAAGSGPAAIEIVIDGKRIRMGTVPPADATDASADPETLVSEDD